MEVPVLRLGGGGYDQLVHPHAGIQEGVSGCHATTNFILTIRV